MILSESIFDMHTTCRAGSPLERGVNRLRCRIINLVNAINRELYTLAWMEACELRRAIARTEPLAQELIAIIEQQATLACFHSLRRVAKRILEFAPRPSFLAIVQARASDPLALRDIWIEQEQQWIAERQAAGPVIIITNGDTLMLHTETLVFCQ